MKLFGLILGAILLIGLAATLISVAAAIALTALV